jgi:3-phosphoshikimate 1-carboxyvinyltransferase
VTRPMLNALTALGVAWQLEGELLTIQGAGLGGLRPPAAAIDCGNSATTLRLLAGALAANGTAATLDGSPGLRRRPMERIVDPLRQMGVAIKATDGCAPLQLSGRPGGQLLRAIQYAQPVASAQVKTCLLLAALAADGPVTLLEPSLSRDHSERMLASMGVEIENFQQAGQAGLRLHPPRAALRPLELEIPGDASAAAFLLVAGLAVPGSQISLGGVLLNPTRSGLLLTLQEMGADIRTCNLRQVSGELVGDLEVRAGPLHGVRVSGGRVVDMIDEFPIFGVAAAFAEGRTEVFDAAELRYKESDRITALCNSLKKLGITLEEKSEGFIIDGNSHISGGLSLDPQGDHRLAMAMAVAGLRAERPLSVDNADIIGESFPDFAGVMGSLGALMKETTGDV